MKLTDVTIPRKREKVTEPITKYSMRLRKKHKAKELGAGAYATVYQHPKYKTVAVKVSEEGNHILKYIEWALQHQDNPYVPKVYGVRRFVNRGNNEYFVLFLEKLKDYSRLRNTTKASILRRHVGDFMDQQDKIEDFFWEIPTKHIITRLRKMKSPSPQVAYLLQALEFFHRRRAYDLHDGNVMLRGKYQIVFTDPLT